MKKKPVGFSAECDGPKQEEQTSSVVVGTTKATDRFEDEGSSGNKQIISHLSTILMSNMSI